MKRYLLIITLLLLIILIIAGCEKQEKINGEFKLLLTVDNWEAYKCTISIDNLKYKRRTYSTIKNDLKIKTGKITIEEYNNLIEQIEKIKFFSIKDFTAIYPYSRANHYKLYIKFDDKENKIEYYPSNHKGLDLLTDKIKKTTNSELGWN